MRKVWIFNGYEELKLLAGFKNSYNCVGLLNIYLQINPWLVSLFLNSTIQILKSNRQKIFEYFQSKFFKKSFCAKKLFS